MLKEGKRYTISELRSAIKESSSEFKPKLGDGVEGGNKKNNSQAVKEIQKNVSNYDGGVKVVSRQFDKPADRNKTTVDVRFNETQPGKEWEDRSKANAHGFPSVDNERNSDSKKNKSLDYEGNESFYENREKLAGDRKSEEKKKQTLGIAGNTKRESVMEGKKPEMLKRLKFKRTIFEDANKAISMVPEEYKKDGNRFIMMDSEGTEYLMECTIDKDFGYAKIEVKSRLNESASERELEEMRRLSGYKSSEYFTSSDKSKETLNSLHESLQSVRALEKSK